MTRWMYFKATVPNTYAQARSRVPTFEEQEDALERVNPFTKYACDCGRRKPTPNWEACDRCSYLDGRTPGAKRVIAQLRDNVAMTLPELAEAIGVEREGVLRTLQRLVVSGRVRRWLEEFQIDVKTRWVKDAEGRSSVGGRTEGAARGMGKGVGRRWVYSLTECSTRSNPQTTRAA